MSYTMENTEVTVRLEHEFQEICDRMESRERRFYEREKVTSDDYENFVERQEEDNKRYQTLKKVLRK